MNTGGWIFLIVSWGAILGLCIFCFRFILARHAADHLVAPLEIEAEIEEAEAEKDHERKEHPER